MVIDISHHNEIESWDEIAKSVDQVFIKATEGQTLRDSQFINNAIGAFKQGIRAGYYHFATLRTKEVEKDATIEAKWFIDTISQVPKPSLPLVLDLEDEQCNLSRGEVLIYIKTFFRQLVLHGYHDYMLYSYTHFLNDHLPINHSLEYIKIWIADYNEPHFVPNGWENIHLLQYTDKGIVQGIKGNVDLNRYV